MVIPVKSDGVVLPGFLYGGIAHNEEMGNIIMKKSASLILGFLFILLTSIQAHAFTPGSFQHIQQAKDGVETFSEYRFYQDYTGVYIFNNDIQNGVKFVWSLNDDGNVSIAVSSKKGLEVADVQVISDENIKVKDLVLARLEDQDHENFDDEPEDYDEELGPVITSPSQQQIPDSSVSAVAKKFKIKSRREYTKMVNGLAFIVDMHTFEPGILVKDVKFKTCDAISYVPLPCSTTNQPILMFITDCVPYRDGPIYMEVYTDQGNFSHRFDR